jgi:hypothetical protein
MREACPTPDVLIVATSGEYPAEWRRVEDHVRGCAACQAQIRTDAATMHAWSMHTEPEAPSRLRARERRFRRAIRRRGAPEGVMATTCRAVTSWPLALTLALAGTMLLTTVLTNPAGHSTFESTLDRAMLCEMGRSPRDRQTVRLRVRPLSASTVHSATASAEELVSAIRSATDGLIGEGWPELTESGERLAEIPRLFDSQGVDAHRPLSAKSYQAWRRRLPSRHDERLSSDQHVTLRTTTAAGPLREATLVLDRVTSCVVAQAWIVNGIGRVEFEAIAR